MDYIILSNVEPRSLKIVEFNRSGRSAAAQKCEISDGQYTESFSAARAPMLTKIWVDQV